MPKMWQKSLCRLATSTWPNNNFGPVYAPSGDRIAFSSDRRYPDVCCEDLFAMRANGGGAIVIPQLLVVVPAKVLVESFTCAVKRKGPAVVGVPVMAPVDGFRVSPVGKEPALIENV